MIRNFLSLSKPLSRCLGLSVLAVLQTAGSSFGQAQQNHAPAERRGFVHPGVVFDLADLDRMKARLNTEPWKTLYANFASGPEAQLNYRMKGPCKVVGREPNLNRAEYESTAGRFLPRPSNGI
jgi:hypothetical protein